MDIENNSIVTDVDTEVLDSQITEISNEFAETYCCDEDDLEMLVAKAMRLGELYERKKWQAAKTQAVPDGFVVVSHKELMELAIAINAVDLATHTESKTNEVRGMWQQVALKLMALGTAQEPVND